MIGRSRRERSDADPLVPAPDREASDWLKGDGAIFINLTNPHLYDLYQLGLHIQLL
jgi:hypothetical protein